MKRKSILIKILVTFGIILITALIIAVVIVFSLSVYRVIGEAVLQAKGGAELFTEYLRDVDMTKIIESDDNEQYIKCRLAMKNICKNMKLSYLYLFTLDEENKTIRYILMASDDAEMDVLLNDERGYDKEVKLDSISSPMLDAAHGKEGKQPEVYVNDYGDVYAWYTPIKDSKGQTIAIIGSESKTQNIIDRSAHYTLIIIFTTFLFVIVLFIGQLVYIYRKIFKPIKLISGCMYNFVEDKKKSLEPLSIKSNDEIQEIADSFDKMTADIAQYIDDIQLMTTERVQGEVELEIAKRIQNGIVPAETRYIESGFNTYAIAQPARSVGGDFYDCFRIDNDKQCIVIGDVSGKGVAAALFMSMTKTMIRERLIAGNSPAETLNYVNSNLCNANPEGMFATVFAAVLDENTGRLKYANAGHTRPLLIGKSCEFVEVDAGIALGLFEDAGIIDDEIVLQKGEGVLIYTDGVTETANKDNIFFGEDRLLEAISDVTDAYDTVSKLQSAVHNFRGEREQFDDLTILSLFREEDGGDIIKLKPELSSVDIIKYVIMEELPDIQYRKKVLLSCEEIFVNIVNYSGASEVEFYCRGNDSGFVIGFEDNGTEFDPVNAPNSDIEFEDLDMGGMGIMLVKQIAKSLSYERKGGKNTLTMVFDMQN